MKQTTSPEIRKAVIYARFSSHSQTEQSIEGQLRDCHEWADRNGYTVISEYVDRALTGTRDTRPDFQRMIQDASKHQFEVVIVWKLDRFARNRYDSAIYKAKLKKHGVRVISVKENISDSPEGIILEGMLESMAEYYSANLSQNIRRGQRESIATGSWCGGAVPLGYKAVDKRLVPDEKTAPAVRWIFESYAAGTPKKRIIDELNRRGIRMRGAKPLTISSLCRLLHNPAYTGRYTYNGEEIPGLSARLIDDDTFAAAQRRAAQNARAPGAGKAKTDYLLQGKVFCGLCGSPLVGESGRSRNGTVHAYYACSAKKKSHTCAKHNERKQPLEDYVVSETVRRLSAPGCAERIASAVAEEYRRSFSAGRADELEKAIARIDRDLDKLVDAILDMPAAARPKISARMDALSAQKADLETDLSLLRIAQDAVPPERDIAAWIRGFCLSDLTDEPLRHRLVDTFINSVYVTDDTVTVLYNLRDADRVTFTEYAAYKEKSKPDACSDLDSLGGANRSKSEQSLIFIRSCFGFVYRRTV